MKTKKERKNLENKENIEDAIEVLRDLEMLLDERIVDMHQVKGLTQARHAYIFYRSKIWKARGLLQNL